MTEHYCVVIDQGRPVDNIYFDNELIAAYYYRMKYNIHFVVTRGRIRTYKEEVTQEILRVKLDKKLIKI